MRFQTYVIIGTSTEVDKESSKLFEEAGVKIKSNSPDTQIIRPEKKHIVIEQIRTLKKHIYQKPLAGSQKIILIEEADRLTVQAQNALLKILEEPPPYALIILKTPEKSTLLPTILSRSVIIRSAKIAPLPNIKTSLDGKNIPELISEISNIENPEIWLDNRLKSLHRNLIDEVQKSKSNTASIEGLIEQCADAKKMLRANVNPKFVLTNLVFSLNS